MLPESNLAAHKSQSASNRRLGLILLTVVLVFFLGILIKRGLLG